MLYEKALAITKDEMDKDAVKERAYLFGSFLGRPHDPRR